MMPMNLELLNQKVQEALASGAAEADIALPGGNTMRMRRTTAPGVKAELEAPNPRGGANLVWRIFEAASAPAPEYPAEAPFLPGLEVTVSVVPRGFTLSWTRLSDAGAAAAQLVAASTADGWVEQRTEAAAQMLSAGIRHTQLRRDQRTRSIMQMGGAKGVMLIEQAADRM